MLQLKKILLHPLFPLSGLLLFACWPNSPFTILAFVGFMPLLWHEANNTNRAKFFFILFLNMLVWNVATTWWIWNASPGGAVGAILANSVLMCFPWMLFNFTKKKLGNAIGYLSLILYWISWEYLHHNWELSWPWLTLGNVFATHPNWVRWYAATGTTGGSVWVLLLNILLFYAVFPERKIRVAFLCIGIIVLPFFISVSLAFFEKKIIQNLGANIVVVQPNVEAYTEKFSTDPAILIDRMIKLSDKEIDAETRLVIWPETAIPTQVWEDEISRDNYYKLVFDFCKKYPQILLVTGIDSYKKLGEENPGRFSVRQLQSGGYYEAFNTAMAIDSSANFTLYHKSKLVPGVESLPSWLGFLGKWFDEFGGTSGSLGRSDSPVVFSLANNPYKPAPIICYESIYGNYVTEYVRRGANVITIITNDGWWGNTPGYKQHMSYARLRAIETGLWVARSANTGISCFISPEGRVIAAQPWATAAAIKMQIPAIQRQTFYVRHGDWLSRIVWPMAALILLAAATSKWWKRNLQ